MKERESGAAVINEECSKESELEPPSRMSRNSAGSIHNKDLCIWCMKPEDKKNPGRPGKSVANEVMDLVVAVEKRKSMSFIQIVCDQPVYTLIVQLKYENPEQFDQIVLFWASSILSVLHVSNQ